MWSYAEELQTSEASNTFERMKQKRKNREKKKNDGASAKLDDSPDSSQDSLETAGRTDEVSLQLQKDGGLEHLVAHSILPCMPQKSTQETSRVLLQLKLLGREGQKKADRVLALPSPKRGRSRQRQGP